MARTSTLIIIYATVTMAIEVAQPLPPIGLRGAPRLAAPAPVKLMPIQQITSAPGILEAGPVPLGRELKFLVHTGETLTPSSPEYMSCLTDTEEDRYMEDWMTSENMTSANCRAHCTEMDSEHTYYATQYGSQCWCGDSERFSDYDQHGPGNCTIQCTGNSSETCGGEWSFSLFHIADGGSGSNATDGSVGMHSNTTTGMHSNATTSMHSNATDGHVGMHSNATDGHVGKHSNATDGHVGTHSTTTHFDTESVTFGDMSDLFDMHNAVRCMHGSSPLSYSDEIAAVAAAYAETLTNSSNCGAELEHSAEEDRNSWGENLYMCGSTELTDDCYSAGVAMFELYDEEVSGKEPTEYLEHASQILWNDTTAVGCAVDSCEKDGWRYNYLVCNYDPVGNILDEYEEQVAAQSSTRAACGYTESMVDRRG